MKLLEVLVDHKEVKYLENAPVGMRYAVVDESTKQILSKHPTKESAKKILGKSQTKILKEASGAPPTNIFPAGELFPFDGGKTWAIGLGDGDRVIRFSGETPDKALEAANRFLENMKPSHRTKPRRLKRAAEVAGNNVEIVEGLSKFRINLQRRVAQANVTSFQALENIPRVGPTLRKVLSSPWWRGAGRIFGGLTIGAELIWAGLSVLNDLDLELEEAQSQGSQEKANEILELRNILIVQISIQLIIALRIIFGNARLFNRALRILKWIVRALQGATAATIVGTIPSAVSLLVTESAWLIAGWIIASPTVQRAMAEWFHGNLIGVILGGAGALGLLAVRTLDELTDGQFGIGALRDTLDIESRQPDGSGEEGEYTSSSEWAKLVFHGLLFPPGRENLLVPYIPPERRATLLRETLRLGESETPAQGDQTEPVPNDETSGVETPDERSARTREQSLRPNYSNPNYTRAQPFTGPR